MKATLFEQTKLPPARCPGTLYGFRARKESFSIISQGKVEAIFSSKPEDRRGIFEEAAGVLKYKQRKKKQNRNCLKQKTTLTVYKILFMS